MPFRGYVVDNAGLAQPATDGITAATPIGSAPTLNAIINRVTTCPSGGIVVLPPSAAGAWITVINGQATNALLVNCSGSVDVINNLAQGTGFSVAALKTVVCTCPAVGSWWTNLSA